MKEIIWTAGAARELQEVFEQLEDFYDGAGMRLMEEIQHLTALLSAHPLLGSVFEKPVRKLLVAKKYGVLYSPETRGVVILSFVDLRRDLQPIRKRLRDWFDGR